MPDKPERLSSILARFVKALRSFGPDVCAAVVASVLAAIKTMPPRKVFNLGIETIVGRGKVDPGNLFTDPKTGRSTVPPELRQDAADVVRAVNSEMSKRGEVWAVEGLPGALGELLIAKLVPPPAAELDGEMMANVERVAEDAAERAVNRALSRHAPPPATPAAG